MRSNRLTLGYLSTFAGFVLISGTASGEVAGSSAALSQKQSPAHVSTYRSDGAIFPAVIQTRRVQKRRSMRVSASGQALSNRKQASHQEESTSGGGFVAAAFGASHAKSVEAEYSAPYGPALAPYVALEVKAKPRAKR